MTHTATVAANIRASMARGGYRIADLAEVIGKTANSASSKYNGRAPITVDEIVTIAEWLDVPVAELFKR